MNRDWVSRECGEDLLGDLAAVGVTGLVIDRAELLGAAPSDLDAVQTATIELNGQQLTIQADPTPTATEIFTALGGR